MTLDNSLPVVQLFELQIDNDRTLFLPGQKVEGHLALTLSRPAKLKSLKVRFSGRISTFLEKKQNSIGVPNETSSITMFKDVTDFLEERDSNAAPGVGQQFEAGPHVFSFTYRMPPTTLPASFLGNYGAIKYELAAVLTCDTQKKNLVKELSVPSTRDSNDPLLQDPSKLEVTSPVGHFLWRNGYFTVTATLPKTGFTSEETCPVSLTIINHSKFPIFLDSVCLKQKVTYVTSDRTRGPKTEKIHRLNYCEHFTEDVREINRLIRFPIPSTSIIDPSISTTILKVTHSIDIKLLSTSKFSRFLKVSIPIVIAGFPYLLFEEAMLRRSVDTLPRYINREGLREVRCSQDVERQDSDSIDDSSNQNGQEEEDASVNQEGITDDFSDIISVGPLTHGSNLEGLSEYLAALAIDSAAMELFQEVSKIQPSPAPVPSSSTSSGLPPLCPPSSSSLP